MVEIKVSDFIAWKIAKNKTNWFNRILKGKGKGKICLLHMKLNF